MIGCFLVQVGGHHRGSRLGGYATVDIEDAPRVIKHTWSFLASGGGYAYRKVPLPDGRKRTVLMHRVIAGLEVGDRREVDHHDGDPLNNQRSNLRICTHAQNLQNHPGIGGTSRYRGVSLASGRGKWRAQISMRDRTHSLGHYDDELVAAEVARRVRAELHPFANEDRTPIPALTAEQAGAAHNAARRRLDILQRRHVDFEPLRAALPAEVAA